MNSGIYLPSTTPPDAYHFPLDRPLRIIHFVADNSQLLQTAVAHLVKAASTESHLNALLVLDKNDNTLNSNNWNSEGLSFKQLSSWSRVGRSYEFYRLCRAYQPDALFIHAPTASHWCKFVSAQAGVKHIVTINKSSDAEIPYGIALEQFAKADEVPLGSRIPGIIMPNGLSGSFYLQLIRALACLRDKHLYPRVFLTGAGTRRDQLAARQLSAALGLDNQIRIAEHCSNLPFLLMHHQIAIIGNPESHQQQIAEAMAAGCATIALSQTNVNQTSIIQPDQDGLLLASDSPELLAEKLEQLLRNSHQAQQLGLSARQRALKEFSLTHMLQTYQQIYGQLAAGFISGSAAA